MAGMMQYNFSSHSNAGSGWSIDMVTVYHPQACRSRLLSRYVRLRRQLTASTMNPSRHSRKARENLACETRPSQGPPWTLLLGRGGAHHVSKSRSDTEWEQDYSQGHGRGTRHFLKYPYISENSRLPPRRRKSSPSSTVSYSSVCLAYKKQVVLLTKKLLSAPIYVPEAEAASAMRIAAIAPLLLCFVVGKNIQPVFRNCRSVRQVV